MNAAGREQALIDLMNRLHRLPCWELLELSRGEAVFLAAVCRAEGEGRSTAVSALCGRTGMLAPAASRLMKHLEERDLIRREVDPENRRIVLVHATWKGYAAFERNRQILWGFWREVLERIPPEDVDEMLRILEQVLDAMAPVMERIQSNQQTEVEHEPDYQCVCGEKKGSVQEQNPGRAV